MIGRRGLFDGTLTERRDETRSRCSVGLGYPAVRKSALEGLISRSEMATCVPDMFFSLKVKVL